MKQSKKIFTRLCLNNWGGITHKVLEFHEYVNLFSGKSGSGKSTIMDAIQIILYGSLSSAFLNKAADDAKNKRSVLSYLRGEQKDGTANRDQQDFYSHLVLEIEDTGLHINTCIGISFEVGRGDTDLKKYEFFSHSGKIPESEYLTEGRVPFSCEQMRKFVASWEKSRDNRGKGNVNRTYPSKESYLNSLYDVILGYIDGKRFVTMEKSAIALKMTNGTGTFIRDYMFPKSTEGTIEKISEQLGAYRDIKERIDDIEKRIGMLDEVHERHMECLLNQTDIIRMETLIRCVDIEDMKTKLEVWEQDLAAIEEKIVENENHRTGLVQEREVKSSDLVEVKANLDSTDYGEKKKRLQAMEDTIKPLEGQSREWRKLVSDLQLWETDDVVTDYVGNPALHLIEEFRKGQITEESCEELRRLLKEARENVEAELTDVNQQKKEIRQQWEEKKAWADDIRNDRKPYRASLKEARSKLSQRLSDQYGRSIKVYVFADLFDVVDEQWKNAIEGRMSRVKHSLITEPAFAHDAAILFRKMKQYEDVDLINSAAIVADQPAVMAGALYEAVETDQKFADVCLKRYLGRIMKCHSVEDLEQVRDGVTPDCYSYSNYMFSHLREKSYTRDACIGRKVSKAKLAQLDADIEKLGKELSELVEMASRLQAAYGFESLNRETETMVELSFAQRELDKKLTEKRKLEAIIEKLENGEIAKLKAQKEELEERIRVLDREIEDCNSIAKEDNKDKGRMEDRIANGKEKLEENLQGYTANEKIEQEVSQALKRQSGNAYKAAKQRELDEKRSQEEENTDRLGNARSKFNKAYPSFGFTGLERKNTCYDDLLEKYKNDFEPKYQKEFDDQCAMVHKSLRDNVIASIHGEIKAAMRHRDEINRLLRSISFSDSTYQIEVKRSDTETGQFYEMLMAKELDSKVSDNKGFDGQMSFGDEPFLEKYQQQIDLLTEKFTPARREDDEKIINYKKKEMEKFADYRNYLSFSMYERVVDETGLEHKNYVDDMAGRDSGGEGQNPKYVALLAGFAMLYMQQSNRDSRIRLVLLDEAFSKMDQERSEVCLKYARKLELQLIVCVPDERLQSLIRNVDSVYGFRRYKNQTTMMHIDKGRYLEMLEGSDGDEKT
ncbi:MAG: SbcC/MukB-like Walker B domain-containing protein [Lachnospiraceae bacterium]|nr:SbcC/MukB-like Walker B domain-containing protein [Lachnospiraceae bacterium]